MKELGVHDIMLSFEQDLRMALYTLDRYNIDANLALVACDEYDVDKASLIESQSDVAKRINEHYIVVLFTFVDHAGARCALQKLIDRYPQYHLKGSLVTLRKGETSEEACQRLVQANRLIHLDPVNQIFHDVDVQQN